MADGVRYAWLDGKIVPVAEAKVSIRADGAISGANVFEGIRGYWNEAEQQLYIFKLDEHLQRLGQSTKMMRMRMPYSLDDIARACIDVIRANELREDIHFIPRVYFGEGHWGNRPEDNPVGAWITLRQGSGGQTLVNGQNVGVSSWRRISDDVMPPRIKAGANYHNSRLAANEARMNGYDGAILLNQQGKVAEGPGACLMLVRNGKVITPTVTDSILESITRTTLLQLFQTELGVPVVEREVNRTELYIADEAFFCGTGAEITPIVSVDRLPVGTGARGPVTKQIQDVYFAIVRGQNPKYAHWVTPVYERVGVAAELAGRRAGA
ncbi:MAG: branched-chain amino acid transaminase [Chloroflexi bacterium]|nr:branched-chain amino acid transaminase [Chloroflexota bacterium]